MKVARIVAPFVLSAITFILSYVLVVRVGEGYVWLMFMGIGIVLAGVGSIALFERSTD